MHYYTPAGGDEFLVNGVGDPRSFQDLTRDATGLHFFDTTDGRALTKQLDYPTGAPQNPLTDAEVLATVESICRSHRRHLHDR